MLSCIQMHIIHMYDLDMSDNDLSAPVGVVSTDLNNIASCAV